jgi:hypothetical protein
MPSSGQIGDKSANSDKVINGTFIGRKTGSKLIDSRGIVGRAAETAEDRAKNQLY